MGRRLAPARNVRARLVVRIVAGWFAACAVAWAAVYGIGLAFVNYPRETVAVAVFLVGCAAVFCEWRDERAERALSERDGRRRQSRSLSAPQDTRRGTTNQLRALAKHHTKGGNR